MSPTFPAPPVLDPLPGDRPNSSYQTASPAPFAEEQHLAVATAYVIVAIPASHRRPADAHILRAQSTLDEAPRDPHWAPGAPSFRPSACSVPWKPLGSAPEILDPQRSSPPLHTHATLIVHLQLKVFLTSPSRPSSPPPWGCQNAVAHCMGEAPLGLICFSCPPPFHPPSAVYLVISRHPGS